MLPLGSMNRPVASGALLVLALAGTPLAAQVDVRVGVGTIKDARNRYGTQDPTGDLVLFTKLEGAGVETAKGFRMRITTAHDDAGHSLLPGTQEAPEWADSVNDPDLWIKLLGTARAASTVTVGGTLDVYLPSLDPGAEVKVDKVFSKAGKPIASQALADAKVEVLVIPQAQSGEGSVILVGGTEGMEKVRSIRVVRADGTEIPAPGRSSSSDGERIQISLSLSEPAPADAGIVFTILTAKSVVSVPFELKDIPLP